MPTPNQTSSARIAGNAATLELAPPVERWWPSTRTRRVFMLLVSLWILNAFDLGFTVLAEIQGALTELNPFARLVLPYGPIALTLFKIVAVGGGSFLLWRRRDHRLTEIGIWFLFGVYVFVVLRWHHLFALLLYIQQHGAPRPQ